MSMGYTATGTSIALTLPPKDGKCPFNYYLYQPKTGEAKCVMASSQVPTVSIQPVPITPPTSSASPLETFLKAKLTKGQIGWFDAIESNRIEGMPDADLRQIHSILTEGVEKFPPKTGVEREIYGYVEVLESEMKKRGISSDAKTKLPGWVLPAVAGAVMVLLLK
jgi:hypothetical protein